MAVIVDWWWYAIPMPFIIVGIASAAFTIVKRRKIQDGKVKALIYGLSGILVLFATFLLFIIIISPELD